MSSFDGLDCWRMTVVPGCLKRRPTILWSLHFSRDKVCIVVNRSKISVTSNKRVPMITSLTFSVIIILCTGECRLLYIERVAFSLRSCVLECFLSDRLLQHTLLHRIIADFEMLYRHHNRFAIWSTDGPINLVTAPGYPYLPHQNDPKTQKRSICCQYYYHTRERWFPSYPWDVANVAPWVKG